ncbi:MAG: DUF5655 domain-containing protein [Actinomycetota bacterium]
MCAPALSLDEYFATAAERERPIFDAVHHHLDALGPLDVDAVQIGILFKNGPVFAELRPKKKWVALSFMLPVKLSSSRFSRKVLRAGGNGSRYYHVVNVREAAEIDDVVLDWLTEAYLAVE